MNSAAHTDLEAIAALSRGLGHYEQIALDAERRASAHLARETERIAEVLRCRRVECESAEATIQVLLELGVASRIGRVTSGFAK